MNDLSSQYETEDGKISLSMVAEAANTQLSNQTEGTISRWVTDDFNKTAVEGQETWTASGFNEDFNSTFSTDDDKKMAIAMHLDSLGNKSEQQYFAVLFPDGIKFSNGQSVKQYLLTITR